MDLFTDPGHARVPIADHELPRRTVTLRSGGPRRDASLNPLVARVRDRLVAIVGEHMPPATTKAAGGDFYQQAQDVLRQSYIDAYGAGYADAYDTYRDLPDDDLSDYPDDFPDDSDSRYTDGSSADPVWADDLDLRYADPAVAAAAADTAVGSQDAFLLHLGALLGAGSLAAHEIGQRLGLYAASLNPVYEQGFAGGVDAGGDVTVTRWVSEGDEKTCTLCEDRNGAEWYGDEDHPYPGDGSFGEVCEGGPNCRCLLEFDVVPADSVPDATAGDGSLGGDVPGDLSGDGSGGDGADLTAFTTADLVALREFLAKYSPDQPRDERGRWTGGAALDVVQTADAYRAKYPPLPPGPAPNPGVSPEKWAAFVRENGLDKEIDRAGPGFATIPPEQAAQILGTLDRLQSEFPQAPVGLVDVRSPAQLGSLVDQSHVSTVVAATVNDSIYFNRAALALPSLRSTDGFHPAGTDNLVGSTTHEYAHVLDHAFLSRQSSPIARSYLAWRGDYAYGTSSRVSGYAVAAGDPRETVAEIFASAFTPGATPTYGAAELRQALAGDYKAPPVRPIHLTTKYSDDEPRDERGRWTSGGGASYDVTQRILAGGGKGPITASTVGILRATELAKLPMAWQTAPLSEIGAMTTAATGTRIDPALLANANPDDLRLALYQLTQLHDRYPGVPISTMKYMDAAAMRAAGAPRGATAATTPDGTGSSTIHLTTVWDRSDPTGAWQFDDGWHPPGVATPAGTITHEFGHAVMTALGRSAALGVILDISGGRAGPNVSGYGRTSPNEEFADRFAELETPTADPTNPGARWMAKFLSGFNVGRPTGQLSLAAIPTADLVAIRAYVAKYSPDQARDDHGRWTSGGGLDYVSQTTFQTALHEGALTVARRDKAVTDIAAKLGLPKDHVTDLVGARAEVVEKAALAVDQVVKDYPALAGKFGTISFATPTEPGVNAWTSREPGGPINMRIDGANRSTFAEDVKAGWAPAGFRGMEDVVVHELGHAVGFLDGDQGIPTAEQYVQAIQRASPGSVSVPSGYAMTAMMGGELREFFADGFAANYLGSPWHGGDATAAQVASGRFFDDLRTRDRQIAKRDAVG